MIKKYYKILIVHFLFAMAFTISSDVQASSFSGQSSVQIVTNLYITETQSMDFGILAVEAGASDIISITPNGTLNANNASVSASGNANNAQFIASGTPNSLVSLSFQNGALSGSGEDMTLTNFSHDAGTSPALNNSGILDVKVGADLHLNADQASGSYSGTYQITINYQ